MSLAVSGFGALQVTATPQIFQALSLGGATPAPPVSAFGTPNGALVPVSTSPHALPLNLSLQAAPVAAAIETITHSPTSQFAPAAGSPSLGGGNGFSTAFSGAHNGNVLVTSGPPGSAGGNGAPPQGIVAFNVSAAEPNAAQLLQPLAPAHEQTAPPPQTQAHAQTPQTSQTPVPVAHTNAIATIVNTIKTIAVAAVYPQPLFSFTA